jgi:hypothetical protein
MSQPEYDSLQSVHVVELSLCLRIYLSSISLCVSENLRCSKVNFSNFRRWIFVSVPCMYVASACVISVSVLPEVCLHLFFYLNLVFVASSLLPVLLLCTSSLSVTASKLRCCSVSAESLFIHLSEFCRCSKRLLMLLQYQHYFFLHCYPMLTVF